MEIKYSEKAAKQIRRIYKGDRKSAEMILETLESYAGSPSAKSFDIKTLKAGMELSKGFAWATTGLYLKKPEILCLYLYMR